MRLLVVAFLVAGATALYQKDNAVCPRQEPPKSCVADGSIPPPDGYNCKNCAFSSECGGGGYCCPSMKKCVVQGSMCYSPTAQCSSCSGTDLSSCSCGDSNFPNNWVDCTDGSGGKANYGNIEKKTYSRKQTSSGALAADDEFAIAQQCQHNFFRQGAGLGPVDWDDSLALFAKEHAIWLKNNRGCEMEHSTSAQRSNPGRFGFDYLGENLYWAWQSSQFQEDGAPAWAKDSVDGWYSEMVYYQYGGEGAAFDSCPMRNLDGRQQIGHLTQLLWDKVTKIGCDYAMCGNSIVVGCVYGPGGNFAGQAPFSQAIADNLNVIKVNEKYGGLPNCNGGGGQGTTTTTAPPPPTTTTTTTAPPTTTAPSSGGGGGQKRCPSTSGVDCVFPYTAPWGTQYHRCAEGLNFSPPNFWCINTQGSWTQCIYNMSPDCPYN